MVPSEIGELFCPNMNCDNNASWNADPPVVSKEKLLEVFLADIAQQISFFEESNDNDPVGALLTIDDTVYEYNGERFEAKPEGTGCALVCDGEMGNVYPYQKEPEIELDDGSTVSVATSRMAEFQAMIDASIVKAESRGIGLMESTVLTWEQQFEIGGPFTFDEDGE
jgi:hypothetical protein